MPGMRRLTRRRRSGEAEGTRLAQNTLAFLDQLTGSEYKELAPDIANKVRVWLIKKRWRRHTIAVVAFLRLQRTLDEQTEEERRASTGGAVSLSARIAPAPREAVRPGTVLARSITKRRIGEDGGEELLLRRADAFTLTSR